MTRIDYVCPDCEHEFEVDVTFPIPAKTNCRVEDSYPEEPGEVDPQECPECGKEVDKQSAIEDAGDKQFDLLC